MKWKQAQTFLAPLVLIAALVLLLIPLKLSSGAFLDDALWDSLHAPFAAACVWLVYAMDWPRSRGRRWRRFLAFCVLLVLAAVEVVQPFIGRTASWVDLYYNLGGVIGAWLVFTVWLDHQKRGWIGILPWVFLIFLPLGHAVWLVRHAETQFPLLSDFQNGGIAVFWQAFGADAEWDREQGRWRVSPNQEEAWASTTLVHPRRDWGGDWTHLEISLESSFEGILTLRLDDKPYPENYADRVQFETRVQTGPQVLCFAREELAQCSGGREVDWSSIHRLAVIFPDTDPSRILSLQKLALTKDSCYPIGP